MIGRLVEFRHCHSRPIGGGVAIWINVIVHPSPFPDFRFSAYQVDAHTITPRAVHDIVPAGVPPRQLLAQFGYALLPNFGELQFRGGVQHFDGLEGLHRSPDDESCICIDPQEFLEWYN